MTKRALDQVLVVDVEATCWDDHRPPHGQRTEIIEIGICCLDVKHGRISRTSLICRPQCSTISDFCTSLTGYVQSDVADASSFSAQCAVLQSKFKSRSRTWASWGIYDHDMMQRQTQRDGVEHPMSSNHINIKNLFSLWRGMKEEVGLTDALRIMRWDFAGKQHVGRDDAWNAARVLSAILWGSESR